MLLRRDDRRSECAGRRTEIAIKEHGQESEGQDGVIIAVLVDLLLRLFGIPHGVTPTALKQALTDRIKLGLDLKGGTHLVLQVHVEEAVGSTTDRDVQRIAGRPGQGGHHRRPVHKLDPVAHPEHDHRQRHSRPPRPATCAASLTATTTPNYDVTIEAGRQRDADDEAGRDHAIWKRRRWTHSIETISERVNALGVAERRCSRMAGRQRDPGGTARNLRSGKGGRRDQVDLEAGGVRGASAGRTRTIRRR